MTDTTSTSHRSAHVGRDVAPGETRRGARSLRSICATVTLFAALVAGATLVSDLRAEEPPGPTPLQDDATLHDVAFVGARIGWAVGDRGTVWRTDDGGATWRFVPVPTTAALRSVCFLTDRIGWIAGGGTLPHVRYGRGVLFATRDGGTTWEQPAEGSLPALRRVRFFGLNDGVAMCETTVEHPAGLIVTQDGGRTWKPIDGAGGRTWRSAAFLGPDHGIVVGAQGRLALFGEGRLFEPRAGSLGTRTLRSIVVGSENDGWIVGDDALVLATGDGGVVWSAPPTPLPTELSDFADFLAVASHGAHVWLAGSPGSTIWHSPDRGRTWNRQRTGQPQPLAALTFRSADEGWAVGTFGTILRTQDGGRRWQAVRGQGRRTAILAVASRPERVPFDLLARYSADEGYRSAVLLPADDASAAPRAAGADLDLLLHEAVVEAGANGAGLDRLLSVTVPGLDRDAPLLAADWNRRTEGRLAARLTGRLAAQLRTWRPDLVVLDEAPRGDALAALLHQAVRRAVEQAADPTQHLAHAELAGLAPWEVRKVYVRRPDGETADAHVDPFAPLPRVKETVRSIATRSGAILGPVQRTTAARSAYRLVFDRARADRFYDAADATRPPRDSGPTLSGEFFAGLVLGPGSAARRPVLPFDETERARREATALKQRNFQAATERFLDDPRQAGQVLAQVRDVARGLSDAESAELLLRLALEHRRRGQVDLEEAVLVELIGRHAEEPASVEGMVRLFHLWSAAEPVWQRLRKGTADRVRLVSDGDVLADRFRRRFEQEFRAAYGLEQPGEATPVSGATNGSEVDPLTRVPKGVELAVGGGDGWRSQAASNWQQQAVRMAALLRTRSPETFAAPEFQFPLATLLMRTGAVRATDAIHRKFASGASGPWRLVGESEQWLLRTSGLPPTKVAVCQRAETRPVLDGILSDRCWQEAQPIALAESLAGDGPRDGFDREAIRSAFALVAYDAEYLYLAASVPRVPDRRADPPVRAGRTHDADLEPFDRLRWAFDVDRDRATAYELEIDQRGTTRDACWGDETWNPQWFVAAEGTDTHWRIEVAVPLAELVPQRPTRGTVWGLGLVRTVPAVRRESWTHPARDALLPSGFGLLRFE